jgi:hypothetical protein
MAKKSYEQMVIEAKLYAASLALVMNKDNAVEVNRANVVRVHYMSSNMIKSERKNLLLKDFNKKSGY